MVLKIIITGFISAAKGLATRGQKVLFKDIYENGEMVSGLFRSEMLSSNSESKVSTVYTPGNIEPDQKILLIASIDSFPEICDTIKITVIDKV